MIIESILPEGFSKKCVAAGQHTEAEDFLSIMSALELKCPCGREHSNQMSVAIAGELRWDKISKANLICSHAEVGLSKAMIAEEYERLAEGLIKSVNEAAGELATEGFVDSFPRYRSLAKRCRMVLRC